MRKHHISEFRKTGFANSGRAAGHGMAEDSYGDESGPGNVIRQGKPVGIAEREEKAKQEMKEAPVKVYYVNQGGNP